MRDVVLTVLIFGALPFVLKRPQFGVLLYVWISVMNPHRLTWGFAYEFPFAAIVAVTTLISAVISKDLRRPPLNFATLSMLAFGAWTGVTTAFALYPEPSFPMWTTLLKTMLMALLIPMLFHRKEDLQLLVWTIVLSIAYYGTKGGMWTIWTGGSERVYGPPRSYIEDNNHIAAAIVMITPLMWYLFTTSQRKLTRWAIIGMVLFCGVAVLGTYSRGALLALSAMGAFLWWKSRHKFSLLLVIVLAVPIALQAMPEKWYARMETIADYQTEGSAGRRLNAWATMLNIAKDRPIVGGGFNLAEKDVYARYSPNPLVPAQVAHSVYFQALGEHGFVGLGFYLLMLYALWSTSKRVIAMTRGAESLHWAHDLAQMIQVSLIGFAVGGAFLSLVNFDVPYYMVGLIAALQQLVRRERIASVPAVARERGAVPIGGGNQA